MTPLKLGHVHLKVRSLDRSLPFYQSIAGLEVTERAGPYAFLSDGVEHHSLALQELGEGAAGPGNRSVGLYHIAFEVANEEEFEEAEKRVRKLTRFAAVDHGISWAIYFDDPDGNGIEIYLDRRGKPGSRESWQGISKALVDSHNA
ncbi:MAG: VOC family protein [Armatimonadetes bacterium]|nr:VOC family protein [Armatimonadota bacterium]